jgi:hypothetical protein
MVVRCLRLNALINLDRSHSQIAVWSAIAPVQPKDALEADNVLLGTRYHGELAIAHPAQDLLC